MTNLPAPSATDQLRKCASLAHALIIPEKRCSRYSVSRFSFRSHHSPALTGVMGTVSEMCRPRSDYNSHMLAVNIAELKARLSSYLQRVRAGEEIVTRDRNLPVANREAK